MKLTLVPEDDVPMPKGPRDEDIDAYIKQLCAMRVGQSCFFLGVKRADVEFLRRPAKAAGINLTIREVERDDIHMSAGVRVWREYGPYDDL